MSVCFHLKSCLRILFLPSWLLISTGALLGAPQSAQAAPPTYTLIDLGYLMGGAGGGSGQAINASGQVAGYSYYDSFGELHAFRYSGTTPPTDLGDLGGFTSQAFGINRSGQVVGESDTDDGDTHAFRTTSNGGITAARDLGTPGLNSTARGINTNGVVTGWSETLTGATHAFRTAGSTITAGDDLGALGGSASFSQGYGINASGQVTGSSTAAGNAQHAFRTTATGTIDVASDLGLLPGGTVSFGRAINDNGQVAGFGDVLGGALRAFRSSANGSSTLTNLGTLGGNSQGFGIDAFGNVVGMSNGSAFLFMDAFGMLNLNNALNATSKSQFPTWTLNSANGINDNGLITGYATDSSARTHAFLLVPDVAPPTPEPGTLALLAASALTGAGVFRRRKRS